MAVCTAVEFQLFLFQFEVSSRFFLATSSLIFREDHQGLSAAQSTTQRTRTSLPQEIQHRNSPVTPGSQPNTLLHWQCILNHIWTLIQLMQLLLNQMISESPPGHHIFLVAFKSSRELEANLSFLLFTSWRHFTTSSWFLPHRLTLFIFPAA